MKIDLTLFQEYLTLKQLSQRTIKEYTAYALRFQTIGAFSSLAISRFLTEKINQNNVARSFILTLKKFLLYYKDELKLTDEEFKEIAQTEVPPISGRKKTKITIPLTPQEIELLERTLETEELKLMLLVCYNGGLRIQELLGIKISSFNWDKLKENPGEMAEVLVYGKGNKEGICLLPSWLIPRVKEYIKANASKFKPDSLLFERSSAYFEKALLNAGLKSGLTRRDNEGKLIDSTRTNPHRLRHSYAGNLLKKGVDIRYIKDAMRHSSISSTQIYTQLDKEELKEKLQEFI
jgi:site-specific recombinase XerD